VRYQSWERSNQGRLRFPGHPKLALVPDEQRGGKKEGGGSALFGSGEKSGNLAEEKHTPQAYPKDVKRGLTNMAGMGDGWGGGEDLGKETTEERFPAAE